VVHKSIAKRRQEKGGSDRGKEKKKAPRWNLKEKRTCPENGEKKGNEPGGEGGGGGFLTGKGGRSK